MPLDAATRTEPAVLHTDALTTSALSQAGLGQQRALAGGEAAAPGDQYGVRGGRRGGPTPAAKTGYGGMFKRRDEAEEARKSWFALLEKGLGVSGDAWKRWATSQGRDRAALDKAVADSIEAFVKAEGLAVAEQLPFSKAITVSLELSVAFAEGVGRGIEKVNAENAKEWDFSLIGQELTPQDVARINAMRGYQAKATQQLNQVLAEGLADVAEKVAGMLLDKLGEIPGKLLKDVAGQVAGQLVKQNDLLAIFNEAVAEAGKSIPAGRAKVEKLAFHFVATAYLNQMQDKELQKKLAALPGVVRADRPVDVALLGTIITMLAENSYETYAKHVPVQEAGTELRQMLLNTARGLAAGLVDVRLEESKSSQVVVEKDRIALPPAWLAAVTQDPSRLGELRNRAWQREKELINYCKRLRISIEERRRTYAKEYARRTHGQSDADVFNELQARWKADWSKAQRQAADAVAAVVKELGEGVDRNSLDMDVRINLGYPNEQGWFTPWVN